ncbi:hypothetical protein AAVH_28253, partial [Aphelenchoides avenae]
YNASLGAHSNRALATRLMALLIRCRRQSTIASSSVTSFRCPHPPTCASMVVRNFPSSNTDSVSPLPAFLTCKQSCPRSRLDAVVQQMIRVVQKECSASVSNEQREKFLQSSDDLYKKMSDRATRCAERVPDGDEALCKTIASCLLESALDELKADYPTDVVTFVADAMKLFLTFALKDPESPPEACFILYEPYNA